MLLGEQIRKAVSAFSTERNSIGITQAELAKRAGVSVELIAKTETRRHKNLTIETFIRIESALALAKLEAEQKKTEAAER